MGLLDTISSYLSWSEPTYVDAESAEPSMDDAESKGDEDVKDDGEGK